MKRNKGIRTGLFIVMLFCMSLPGVLQAQNRQLRAGRQLDNRSGLSHNTVYCIYQDREGFIWFGTRYGLNRYDGREYRIYHNTHTSGCIGGDCIQCIAEDVEGFLWIGTDNGISIYNPQTDRFRPFDVTTADGKPIRGVVPNLCFADDGTLWINSDQGDYCYSDGRLQSLDYEDLYAETGGHARTLLAVKDGMYIAQRERLLFTNNGGRTFRTKATFPYEPSVLCEYAPGQLLLGTRAEGLYIVDLATGELTLVPMEEGSSFSAKDFYPYSLIRMPDGGFLIGSEWGLFAFRQGVLQSLGSYVNPSNIVDVVFDICRDRDGGIWIANNFSGVNYYPLRQSIFDCYTSDGTPQSITGNVVRAIVEDAHGDLWVGTEDSGLCHFDAATHTFSTVEAADGTPLYLLDIQDLTLVGDDELAIGTYRGGVYLYNIETGVLRHYMDKSDVMTVYERADHTLLFTVSGYVYQLDPRTDNEPRVFVETLGSPSDLIEDYHGRLWLSMRDGLSCYDPSRQVTRHYAHDPADATSICSGRLAELFIDSRDRLWVASENAGLYCYDELQNAFWSITMTNGLPSDAVNTVAEDDDGKLWVGTSNGLAVVDPSSRSVQATYSLDDGLASKHVTLKSAKRLRSGDMAFGTFSGLVIANQSRRSVQPAAPSVTLTGLHIYNEEILPPVSPREQHGSIVSTTMPYAHAITLPYKKQTFTLSYTTFDYRHQELGRFAYRLDGLDRQWNYVNNVGQISYHNVPAGHYTFCIRALDSHSHESGPETRLTVNVRSPWWHIWPMRILYILLFVATAWLIMRFRAQRRRDREQMRLAEQNQEKEKELYQAKIDFFTNIAHEIRTPASLIKDPLHTLRQKGVPKDVDATLALVERNADSLNTLINELLDFRKVEAGVGQVHPAPQEFAAIVREVWEGFRPAAEARGLRCNLSMPAASVVANVDLAATRKIVRNLCSNALKFAESYIRLVVDVDRDTDSVRLTLSNDGTPIPADMRQKLFEPFVQIRADRLPVQGTGLGLPLALSLAELQGGSLYIDAEAPDNTFVLHLPLAEQPAEPSGETITSSVIPAANDDEGPAGDDDRSYLLIVEDNDDLRTYIASCLDETYSILEASNGMEALQMLRGHNIQLVLSDVMMPIKDGLALCRDIKNDPALCHIPVVLLTAKDTVADHVRGLSDGADVYIPKPFDMDKLKAQIASLLHNRQLLRVAFAHDPQTETLALAQTPSDERFLTNTTECILAHIDDPEWTVDDLAEHVGMSRSTLTRKIKALADQTPNEFVRIVRLRRAAELLREDHYRLNEVCVMVGFSNSQYFSNLFKEQFGMRPTEYSRQVRASAKDSENKLLK